jgi:hypothetical protein
MLRFGLCFSCVLLLAIAAAPAVAAISDNFNDNSTGSQWSLVQDSPVKLWLEETNQRLELRAADPTSSSDDALYLSSGTSGFQLKTSSDFSASIDYNFGAFTPATGGSIALVFGIGRDLAGTDSAAIGYSRSSNALFDGALGAAYRVANVQTNILVAIPFFDSSGTFTVNYTSATDRLTLGANGSTANIYNVVQGKWNADKVWVSFGGRGSGLNLASGNAYLDNFTATGDIVAAPEPATLALVAAGGVAALLRRRRK